MNKYLLLLVALLLPMIASADAVEIDGIYYNLITKARIAEVTINPNKYKGDVVIPQKIIYEGNDYSVKTIGGYSFKNSTELKTISIPNSIETIGDEAFFGCTGLETITIPKSVKTFEAYAFSECNNLKSVNINDLAAWCAIDMKYNAGSNPLTNEKNPILLLDNEEIKDLIIPEGVTAIGNYTFASCKNITSLTIPNSVLSIGNSSFSGCQNLETVSFCDNINTIGEYCFSDCSKLKSVNLPKSLLKIENGVFANCKELNEVSFGENVLSIGNLAFLKCDKLSEIVIPNSVCSIGNSSFSGCTGLKNLVILNGTLSIDEFAFYDCTALTTISIGNGIRSIKKFSFSNCSELSDFYCFSENVPNTDSNAFQDSYIEYATLHVPASSINNYKNTVPWSHFKNIIKINMPEHLLIYTVDGEVYKKYSIEEGKSITPEASPVKEGYTFSGWSEIPETMPAHDVTVTGTFIINKYKLTYTVDGEEYKSNEIEYGATITPDVAPTKEGYTFSGWGDIPETMPAHDVTVTGTFTINKYKLTYRVDGEEYKSYEVEYGVAIILETEPAKEGYTFSGWSDIPETMPAHDVTVTGTFIINKYKLTYTVDGEEYKSNEIEYGGTITPDVAPTKEGYTFSGWSEIPETMPAKDVTVTGTFTINKYKLTYTVDGAEYKNYEIEYGATITPETEPTKEGYTFNGWSELPETMPAHDVTITGIFTINSYKLTYMIDDEVYKETMYEYGATITPEPQPKGDFASFEWTDLPQTMPAHNVVVHANYTSGIVEVLTDSNQDIRIYSLNGKQYQVLQKGVNIIRWGNGKSKIIVVR